MYFDVEGSGTSYSAALSDGLESLSLLGCGLQQNMKESEWS